MKCILLGGYLDNGTYVESFASILQNAIGWLTAAGVLVIKFEDLVGSNGGGNDNLQKEVFSKIIDFIGADSSNEIDYASKLFGESKTFRAGKIGSWRLDLSPDLIRLMEDNISYLLPYYGVESCDAVIEAASSNV